MPVFNKRKKRVVHVLPETLKDESETYERIPEDENDHVMNRGKPRKPRRPAKPRKPHRPEIPRAVTPAPRKPPRPVKPVKPVKPVPILKPLKLPKKPIPVEPRRWTQPRPDRYHKQAHSVAARFLAETEGPEQA